MSEANDIIKDFSEREFRSFGSTALFANLKWWANEENNQCNPETLDKALVILDDIILNEYKDDFLVKVVKGDVFYRARTVSIDDYGNIEKGVYSSKTRLHGYDWKESKDPPAKYAAAGRNSKQKERALYMASNEITACAEVRPPIRALVSIAKFTADKEMTILDFSKKQGYSKPLNIKDREYDIDTRKYISKVLSLFSVPVYNTEEYKITQKIISHYRKKGYYGVKYKSFYADGCNFTFFDEYINNFSWEDSRVVLNYATSNLFISLDQEEKCQDIDNIDNVKKEITSDLRKQMWKDIKNAWNFSLPIDEFKIAFSMHKSIVSGEHLTQKQLAEKENVDIKKVQLVQKKLKKAKKIKYVGVGKNGHWEWNDN